jgi:hypothetical protein
MLSLCCQDNRAAPGIGSSASLLKPLRFAGGKALLSNFMHAQAPEKTQKLLIVSTALWAVQRHDEYQCVAM